MTWHTWGGVVFCCMGCVFEFNFVCFFGLFALLDHGCCHHSFVIIICYHLEEMAVALLKTDEVGGVD